MFVDVVRIGNSKGIRIPAYVLRDCNITDRVEMEVQDGKIIIFPIGKPREKWDEKFKEMHKNGDDLPLIDEDLSEDLEGWEWQ